MGTGSGGLVGFDRQPVVGGFHPDPSVCRVGDDYYLATSSFEYAPGVPVFHSTDLVGWELASNVLTRHEQFAAGTVAPSAGIYAPTLRFHDGLFWLITTNVGGPEGQLLVTAEDPRGPWSDPVYIEGLPGIDPDIAWDDDGSCVVTFCCTLPGQQGIKQARVDPGRGVLLEEPRSLWSGTGLAHPEAPHLYRVDGWWYLMIAEGGTERGHCVSVARSRDIDGPFEGAPSNPVLSHRSSTHPVQNTGHADLVRRVDGGWAAVYLGVRPRGATPHFHVNGRETFLSDVEWVDGWPVFETERTPGGGRSVSQTSFVDSFEEGPLHPRWVSPGAFPGDFATFVDGGGLQVEAVSTPNGSPSMLGVRTADEHWTVDVEVLPGDGACSLLLRLDDRHWCAVRLDGGVARGVLRIGPVECEIGDAVHDLGSSPVLRISSVPATFGGPDDVQLAVVAGGVAQVIGRFDGRYLSTEVAGGFTGRVVGVVPERGSVRLKSFRYQRD